MTRHLISIKFSIIVIGLIGSVIGRCGTGEWSCMGPDLGLKCISLNKFCDGTRNCPDGSDEPPECTNCNKTYTGKAGVKYPLRVVGPVNRFLPFVCRINFVAMGGDFGDSVELNFLTFQIGKFEYSRNQTSSCSKGQMSIIEPTLSVVDDFSKDSQAYGSFCGRMSDTSVTYYASSSNITLHITVPGMTSLPSASPFSLFFTFRFLSRQYRKRNGLEYEEKKFHTGTAVPGTFCDRMFLNCHPVPCRIRSPNFPGFYPRNMTCNYSIKQMHVPHGSIAAIVLHQKNDNKIFVPRRAASNMAASSTGVPLLSSNCSGHVSDSIRIFDGPSSNMPLIVKLCGNGAVPYVISSGPEVLVQLYSASHSVLCSSRMELEIFVKFEPENAAFMQKDRKRCNYIIDANRHSRQGVVSSPRYTMPDNSSCVYKFIGASSYDRLWLYFVSYFSTHKTVESEECKYVDLELFDSKEQWPVSEIGDSFDSFPLQFCGGSRSPKTCSHASDFAPFYSPGRPCQLIHESYLSSGPTFAIKHNFHPSSLIVDEFSSSYFTARYEFVDTRQDGVEIPKSQCDRRFDSRSAKGGFISNPRNIFLYGRGGRQNISCAFHFVGMLSERVRITIFKVKLSTSNSGRDCETKFDVTNQKYNCVMGSMNKTSRMALIRGIEYGDGYTSTIGCICNTTVQNKAVKYVFDSIVSNVKLVFSVQGMTAFEDFDDFKFEAKFEFFNSTLCDTHIFQNEKTSNSEGAIEFHVPHGRINFTSGADTLKPLRCRWKIQSTADKYLYLRFKSSDVTPNKCSGVVALIYIHDLTSKPSIIACFLPDSNVPYQRLKEHYVFSDSWYNDSAILAHPDHKDTIFIEMVSRSNWMGTKLSFHWLEVVKPFYVTTGLALRNIDCQYECPEIAACIDPSLWCDGTEHCPSGIDESSINCHPLAKNTQYLYLVLCMSGLVLVASMLIIVWAVVRHRNSQRSSDNDTEDGSKDFEDMFTHIEGFPMENHIS